MYNKPVMALGELSQHFLRQRGNQEKPQNLWGPAEILRGYFLSTSCEHHLLTTKPLPLCVGRLEEALITPVCGSRFTFKLDMRAVILTAVWPTTADRTGLTLCTLQTEGEKKTKKKKKGCNYCYRRKLKIYFCQCSQVVPACLSCKARLQHTFTGKTNCLGNSEKWIDIIHRDSVRTSQKIICTHYKYQAVRVA